MVLPDADLKVYLDASVEARARRRLEEYQAKGANGTYEGVLDDMRRRDAQDSERAVAPLRPADDAVVIDNTTLDADEVLAQVLALLAERGCVPVDAA